jgi:hypothetical protein
MKRSLFIGVLACVIACGSALAQDATCASKAISKDGKALAGAAKASFVKKCCAQSAMSKTGKPLSGAAKSSYMKKCMAAG